MVFLELEIIEIIAAVCDRRGAIERLLRDGEERKARRERERLLRAADQHVDAEFILRDGQRTERANGVDDRDDFGKFANDLHQGWKVAHAATGGFVVN